MEDLAHLPTVRFTQEKDEYLYYSENFVDISDSSLMFNVTDRATLNGILERTDAYATGSGFLDAQSVNGIQLFHLWIIWITRWFMFAVKELTCRRVLSSLSMLCLTTLILINHRRTYA